MPHQHCMTSPRGDDYPPVLRLSLPNLHLDHESENLNPQAAAASNTTGNARSRLRPARDDQHNRLCMRYNISPIRRSAPHHHHNLAMPSHHQQASSQLLSMDLAGRLDGQQPASHHSQEQLNSNNNHGFTVQCNENKNNYFEAPYLTQSRVQSVPAQETLLTGVGIQHQRHPFRSDVTTLERLFRRQQQVAHEIVLPGEGHDILGDPTRTLYKAYEYKPTGVLDIYPDKKSPRFKILSCGILIIVLAVYHVVLLVTAAILTSKSDCYLVPNHLLVLLSVCLVAIVVETGRSLAERESECHKMDQRWHSHMPTEIVMIATTCLSVMMHGFILSWTLVGPAYVSAGLMTNSPDKINSCRYFLRFSMGHYVLVAIVSMVRCILYCPSKFCQGVWAILTTAASTRPPFETIEQSNPFTTILPPLKQDTFRLTAKQTFAI